MNLFHSIHYQLTHIDSNEFIKHNNLYLALNNPHALFEWISEVPCQVLKTKVGSIERLKKNFNCV